MRDTPRPPPILLPAVGDARAADCETNVNHSYGTPSPYGLSSLLLQTPYSQLPSQATHTRRFFAWTPQPLTASHNNSSSTFLRHQATAWQGLFTFFDHFPPEIRIKIYGYLVEEIVASVNAFSTPTVRTFKRKPLAGHLGSTPYISLPYRTILRPHSNWLCISRQFFLESREVLWRNIIVKFERRWDFVNAYLRGTFVADAPIETPLGIEALNLYPMKVNIFSHVGELHLDLTKGSDFDGRVTFAEASRVTTLMLQIIARDMPALKRLFFVVDDRSRLSSSIIAFLPDPWFVENLLSIKHVRTVAFASGPGWQGHAQNKKNARSCLCAMNAVLGAHFALRHSRIKLDADGITGVPLQARLGRRMLRYFTASNTIHRNAQDALAMKIVLLESES